jgi:hypothetical protein
MRLVAFLLAAGLLASAATAAWACPMQQTAGKGQVVASSGGQAQSTPIPRRSQAGPNG